MLMLDDKLNFSLVQGDNGGIEFFLTGYKIKESDIIKFVLYSGSRQIVVKEPVLLRDGKVYFYFDSNETRNIPLGEMSYDIIVNIKEYNRNETVINNKKFIVKEGVNYA